MNFLACWDSSTTLYSSDWTYPSPENAALGCVNSTFNDTSIYDAVADCATGDMADNLKKEAAAYLDAAFPSGVSLPHVVINDQPQDIFQNGTDFWTFTGAICDAG